MKILRVSLLVFFALFFNSFELRLAAILLRASFFFTILASGIPNLIAVSFNPEEIVIKTSNGVAIGGFFILKEEVYQMSKQEISDMFKLVDFLEDMPYTLDEEIIDELCRHFLPKRIWERKS